MTPKIKVKADEAFCRKKGCHNPPRHRHHKGHEFLFAHRWMGTEDKKKKAFTERYWKFLDKDVVRICDRHHAEVHLDFDEIILRDRIERKKFSMSEYSYKEAMELVKKLKAYTDEWLERVTPGVDPKLIFGEGLSRFTGRKRKRIAHRRLRDKRKEEQDGGEEEGN